MHAVRQEIVILFLFAVSNDWRACGFELFDGVSNCVFIERSKGRILTTEFGDSLEEVMRPRDTANGLGRYAGWCKFSVGHACTSISLEHPNGILHPTVGCGANHAWEII